MFIQPIAIFEDDDGYEALVLFKGDEVSWVNMKNEKFTGKALEVEGDCLHVKTETGSEAVSVFTKGNVTIDMNNGKVIINEEE